MTTTPLPQPFGWLCEWRQPVGEENTQIFYYGEPGSAIEDDWSRTPDVHKNLPLFTVEQLHQARADLEAEVQRLREELVAQQPQAEPDTYCVTTPDGDCISTDPRCMHQPQAEAPPSDVVRGAEKCGACIEAHAVLDADPSKIIRNAEDGYPSGRNPKILTLAERVSALCTYAADWKRWCTEKDNAPIANQIDRGVVVSFAVDRWLAEVANRPLVNVHRRTLDDTWRQVIRRFGGDPVELLGPPHDELAAIAQQKGGV